MEKEKRTYYDLLYLHGFNMGGCLTPIGDPPLLMGFMRGVPFFWSLHLFPVLIFNMVILLFVFYQIDKRSSEKILQMAVNRISVNRVLSFVWMDCTISSSL